MCTDTLIMTAEQQHKGAARYANINGKKVHGKYGRVFCV